MRKEDKKDFQNKNLKKEIKNSADTKKSKKKGTLRKISMKMDK